MNQPDPKTITEIIHSIRKTWTQTLGARLDMAQTLILQNRQNRTLIACFAGWYGYSQVKDQKKTRYDDDGAIVYLGRRFVFSHASKMLAKRLGFENTNKLLDWAEANPQLWGNEYGAHMFAGFKAYPKAETADTENRMEILLKHWEEVADRIAGGQHQTFP